MVARVVEGVVLFPVSKQRLGRISVQGRNEDV